MRPTLISQALQPSPLSWREKWGFPKGGWECLGISVGIVFILVVACSELEKIFPPSTSAKQHESDPQKTGSGLLDVQSGNYLPAGMSDEDLKILAALRNGTYILVPEGYQEPSVIPAVAYVPDEVATPATQNLGSIDGINGNYLGRIGSLPEQKPNLHGKRPDLTAALNPKGLQDQSIPANAIIEKPVVDLRYIVPPAGASYRKDTVTVVVRMLLSTDNTCSVQLVSETDHYYGYGAATVQGLQRGRHRTTYIDGTPVPVEIELTIPFCHECGKELLTTNMKILR